MIDWLAAALVPHDIAPHPNFGSTEQIRGPQLLAVLVQLRFGDFDHLVAEISTAKDEASAEPLLPQSDFSTLVAVRHALDVQSMELGLRELGDCIAEHGGSDGRRSALTLVLSTVLCEQDRQHEAIEIVQATLDAIGQSRTAGHRLLRAVLLQQLAFRKSELGWPSESDAEAALDLLRGLRPSDFEHFRTSVGVRWRSPTTVKVMLEQCLAISDSHVASIQRSVGSRDWVRFVRAPSPALRLRTAGRAEAGLSKFVEEIFNAQMSSSETRFTVGDPVEDNIYEAMLHYELAGSSGDARSWRRKIGMLRAVRPIGDMVWSYQESLRLLRQADDAKLLDLLVRKVRSEGPLAALRRDAVQVSENRGPTRSLRSVDLLTLGAAAPVLTEVEASQAYDQVVAALSEGPPPMMGRWEAEAIWLGRAWNAAVELSSRTFRADDAARELLGAAAEHDLRDALLARELGRSLFSLDWETVSEEAQAAWLDLYRRHSDWPESLRVTLRSVLNVDLDDHRPAEVAGVDGVAEYLNRFFRTGVRPRADVLAKCEQLVAGALQSIQQQAAAGMHTFGSVSTADVAAGLVLHFGSDSLVEPLADFLSDANVTRSEKGSALDRLAQAAPSSLGELPGIVGRRAEYLLRTPADEVFSHDGADPFPAALRFLGAHRQISDLTLMQSCLRLAASSDVPGRIDAARTVAVLLSSTHEAAWLAPMALQLSYDSEPLVTAEGGRCLASLLGTTSAYREAAVSRLGNLLDHDGMLVPLLTLRGLAALGSETSLEESLLHTVEALSTAHIAFGVRLQARAVLER